MQVDAKMLFILQESTTVLHALRKSLHVYVFLFFFCCTSLCRGLYRKIPFNIYLSHSSCIFLQIYHINKITFSSTPRPKVSHCKQGKEKSRSRRLAEELAYFRVSSFRVNLKRLCEIQTLTFIDDNKYLI